MLRDTTDRPLSAIKVIRAGGSAAFPGMVSSSQFDRPDRNLLKKKPPNLSGAHGVPAWMPLPVHAPAPYYDGCDRHLEYLQ